MSLGDAANIPTQSVFQGRRHWGIVSGLDGARSACRLSARCTPGSRQGLSTNVLTSCQLEVRSLRVALLHLTRRSRVQNGWDYLSDMLANATAHQPGHGTKAAKKPNAAKMLCVGISRPFPGDMQKCTAQRSMRFTQPNRDAKTT